MFKIQSNLGALLHLHKNFRSKSNQGNSLESPVMKKGSSLGNFWKAFWEMMNAPEPTYSVHTVATTFSTQGSGGEVSTSLTPVSSVPLVEGVPLIIKVLSLSSGEEVNI